MQKKYIIASILIALIGVQSLSFTTKTPEEIINELTISFHKGLDELEQNIQILKNSISALDGSAASVEALRTAHINTRLTFKSVEYLMNYIDPEAIRKSINGAPLPTVEPNVPEVVVIEPSGLQVLDEMAFEEKPHLEKEAF